MGLLMDSMWSQKFMLFLLCFHKKEKERRYLTLAPHESLKYLMTKAPSLWQVSWNVRNSFVVLLLWLNLALELHSVGYENIDCGHSTWGDGNQTFWISEIFFLSYLSNATKPHNPSSQSQLAVCPPHWNSQYLFLWPTLLLIYSPPVFLNVWNIIGNGFWILILTDGDGNQSQGTS